MSAGKSTAPARICVLSGEGERYLVLFPGGAVHLVEKTFDGLECDCEGYTYRRDCRHLSELRRLLPMADREAARFAQEVKAA